MSFVIAGIGTATPEYAIAQEDAADLAAALRAADGLPLRALPILYRRAGVAQRYSVLLGATTDDCSERQTFYRQATSPTDRGPTTRARMARYEASAAPLAVAAARGALLEAHLAGTAVTHLVTVSCSGFCAPGFDVALIRELGLRPDTARTHIGFMGCHAALNGLRVARAFADADPQACVLLCAVELCSLHHQYTADPQLLVANALFADGAAAVVGRVQPSNGAPAWRLVASGSTLIPESEDAMGWQIHDHGFQMYLSPRVPELIEGHLRPWLETWLDEQGLTIAQIGSWAVHPGGPRILQACAAAVGFQVDRMQVSTEILHDYGNMSSPTILFILQRLRQRAAARPCVLLAFGPGLTVEAALVR